MRSTRYDSGRRPRQGHGRVPAAVGPGGDAGERAACIAVLAVGALSVSFWLAGGLSAVATGGAWPEIPFREALTLFTGVLRHPGSPRLAWPPLARRELPSAPIWYGALALVWSALSAVVFAAVRLVRTGRPGKARSSLAGSAGRRPSGAAWAGRVEVGRLAVRRPGAGRLVLGRAGRRLVAVERGQSVLVVGPTQSGKTSGLAIPALLEWEGPVLATSVKTDLVRDTSAVRRSAGRVHVFDPTGVSGERSAGWSPLAGASSWGGARKVAAGLCGVARASGAGMDDAGFWYATAEKLLAPLLFAAASSQRSITDVVRWVDTGEIREVLVALEAAGVAEAVQAAEASFSREERQRSSVYTTAETVLSAYADPAVAMTCAHHDLDPAALLDGGRHTVYLVAPTHEQDRLQSIFVAIIRSVVEEALTRSSRLGRPLDPPLLLVLDEAANVAPLASLDTLAATASSHGIQLVTVWQDLAQVEARYGPRAATVVNNHRAKVLCSGITDAATLEQASRLIGDEEHAVGSSTVDASGSWSRTTSVGQRRLAPVERLRCLQPGEAVLLYGHLQPLQLELRPFYEERAYGARQAATARQVGSGPAGPAGPAPGSTQASRDGPRRGRSGRARARRRKALAELLPWLHRP